MTLNRMIERPRTARSIARRQHLLQTARTLFIEKGFHQTGVAQISTASGVGVGQIYRDFTNKEAIVRAICESDLTNWLEEEKLKAAIASGDKKTIFTWIEHIACGEHSKDGRRLMCELLAEVGRNQIISEINRNAEQRIFPNLTQAIRSLIPQASEQKISALMDFIMAISWGISARRELSPSHDTSNVASYISALLCEELGISRLE